MRAFNSFLARWILPPLAGAHAAAAANFGTANLAEFCWMLGTAAFLMAGTLPYHRWIEARRAAVPRPQAQPLGQPVTA